VAGEKNNTDIVDFTNFLETVTTNNKKQQRLSVLKEKMDKELDKEEDFNVRILIVTDYIENIFNILNNKKLITAAQTKRRILKYQKPIKAKAKKKTAAKKPAKTTTKKKIEKKPTKTTAKKKTTKCKKIAKKQR
jgi:hypothetical protein